jgi:hypothetical protein
MKSTTGAAGGGVVPRNADSACTFPWKLEAALRNFVGYNNNERYHEALGNVTPADVYFGRRYEVLTERSKIKRRTMERRKKEYLAAKAA